MQEIIKKHLKLLILWYLTHYQFVTDFKKFLKNEFTILFYLRSVRENGIVMLKEIIYYVTKSDAGNISQI